jgi:hypothetical protein
MRTTTLTLTLAALLLAATTPAHAGWTNDPVNGMAPVCTASGSQTTPLITMMANEKVFICWSDARTSIAREYYQILTPQGDPILAENGQPVLDGNWSYGGPVLPDGEGGCIVVMLDKRSGYYQIYGQRFDSVGNRLWGDTGLPLAIWPNSTDMLFKDVACDSLGNFFAGYVVNWAGSALQYVQKFDRDGQRLWGDYGACTVSGANDYQQIVPDGRGGIMEGWQGNSLGFQHLDAAGNPLLPVGGILLRYLNGAYFPGSILMGGVQDGLGGAVFNTQNFYYWPFSDLYMIRVNGHGDTQWTYTFPTNLQQGFNPVFFLPADSSFWVGRGCAATPQNQQYLHRFSLSGRQTYVSPPHDYSAYQLIPWANGVIALEVTLNINLQASKLTLTGQRLWQNMVAVRFVSNASSNFAAAVADGQGGMVCAFRHWVTGNNYDIYAQRVNADGSLGSP